MLLLAIGAALAGAPEVRLTVRAGGTAAQCALRDRSGASAGARLREAGAGVRLWQRLPGDVVSCSGPGFEPLDLDPGQAPLPAELALDLPPARPVTLEGDWGEASIEWRELRAGHTSLVARRSMRVAGPLMLPVARTDRVLRVRPPGGSPVSFFIPAGGAALTLRLPARQPGGEVFGLLPPHAFRPQELVLSAAMRIPLNGGRAFRAGGLAPGAYRMVPRYRGGLEAEPVPLVVRAGETLELLPLPVDEPAAVTLTAGDEVCQRGQLPARLAIRKVMADPPSHPPLVTQAIVAAPCRRELEGFAAGLYEAQLLRERSGQPPEVLATARWDAVAGQKAAVALAAPEVRISGRLTFGADRPAAGHTLAFDRDGQRWTTAAASEDGEFALSLGAVGDYAVTVQTPAGVAAASFTRHLAAGDRRADFQLPEAGVHVRLSRADGAAIAGAVQVALIPKTGERLTASWTPGVEPEVHFDGVPFGEYVVTGTAGGGLASARELRVGLTPDDPRAEVELVLERQSLRLIVVDEQGAPIAGAGIVVGEAMLEGRGTGVFQLEGVPAGERLRVHAEGYAPVCRALQPEDLPEMRVVLVHATEALLLHVPPGVAWEDGLLLGLPGSNCAVVVTELLTGPYAGTPDTIVLRVPRGRFELLLGAQAYAAIAPGAGLHLTGAR